MKSCIKCGGSAYREFDTLCDHEAPPQRYGVRCVSLPQAFGREMGFRVVCINEACIVCANHAAMSGRSHIDGKGYYHPIREGAIAEWRADHMRCARVVEKALRLSENYGVPPATVRAYLLERGLL